VKLSDLPTGSDVDTEVVRSVPDNPDSAVVDVAPSEPKTTRQKKWFDCLVVYVGFSGNLLSE